MDYPRKVGSIVWLDVIVCSRLWVSPADIRNIITRGVEQADILKLSADEIEFIGEQSSLPARPLDKSWLNTVGDALLARGPRLVIITLGSHGALLLTEKHRVEIPQLPVRPVDTTGARDAFMAATLYQLV